ncbi:MAG TPA: hypothetical protein VFO66_01070 [Gemmatimonadaceae bacterium]|nr:hypothetical protein [Gemmatimonadaceae bacterium]
MSRRVPRLLLFAALASLPGVRAVGAQTIAVSGNPGLLRVTTAVPGSEPIAVSNSATTYTVVTPTNPNRPYKVLAQLNAAMPVGLTLAATLDPPPGATSLGPIALDMVARDVVSGIPRSTNSTQGMTWTFTATVAAGVVPPTTRIVTLTIVRGP